MYCLRCVELRVAKHHFTHCPFYIWLRQSVPALVVYPPFDAPHMLPCRGTCHDRTQFLHEPCQVVKQNLSLFIHDILQERFHPALLRPVHISLREGSLGMVMLLFIKWQEAISAKRYDLHDEKQLDDPEATCTQRNMNRSQQSWVKTFMRDAMDENGQPLFDNLTWFAKKL